MNNWGQYTEFHNLASSLTSSIMLDKLLNLYALDYAYLQKGNNNSNNN